MTTNYIASVPKIKGRENYDEWSFAADNLLVLEGMDIYIKPTPNFEVKPVDDAKTKAKLVLTIDPSLYVHVKNTKSSAELWTTLKTMCSVFKP
ncbi:jg25399 [Pararge aegeria aegeria]|uniref:Jg25399 protein n=1 Tax=Pararge aegeria aegeria TaxID=348720 RepID=A0A8S4QZR0_9NEOP|nr:jg25399 [Pararge aegeria aegeria]